MLTERPDSTLADSDLAPPAIPKDRQRSAIRIQATGWRALLVGCLALAAISVVSIPRSIAYDPWSWLIWGRQITHLDLNTRLAATAVKPLPIFFDALVAPTGSLAPVLWLLVARAAALLAIALAFRIAYREGGAVAGTVAAICLAVCHQYVSYLFLTGMSEPMAAAAMLGAVDSHLMGRRRWTLVFLVAASLLRAEAWPFLVLYCLWLARFAAPWRRVALAALAAVSVGIWFVIDKFGSGQFLRSAGAAARQTQGGPLLSREPGLATVQETWKLMSGPVVVLFALGLVAAVMAWRRTGRPGNTACIGLAAIGWLIVDAALAQGRFATGAPRYLVPGVAMASVVAGVVVADAGRALLRGRAARPAWAAVAVVGGLVVTAAFVPVAITTGKNVRAGVIEARGGSTTVSNLSRVISLVGGPAAITDCGPIIARPYQVPVLAWKLRTSLATVMLLPGPTGTVLQQDRLPRVTADGRYHLIGAAGSGLDRWTVLSTCAK